MKRFLTTGFLGAILGIVMVGAPADASLISRGFFDEKIANYATLDLLDSKANQSDFTDLSSKIGELPEGLTVANLYDGWTDAKGRTYNGLTAINELTLGTKMLTVYDIEKDTTKAIFALDNGGKFDFLDMLKFMFEFDGWASADGSGALAPFWYLTQQAVRLGDIPQGKTVAGMLGTLPDGLTVQGMYEGWTDKTTNTNYLGITGLNNAIGTLPDGLTVQGMYEGWTDSNEVVHSGLDTISNDYDGLLGLFGANNLMNLFFKGGTVAIPGFYPTILPLYALSEGVSKIGTLPTGDLSGGAAYSDLLTFMNQRFGIEPTYPTSLAGLMKLLLGNNGSDGSPAFPGIIMSMYDGYPARDIDGDGNSDNMSIRENYLLATNAKAHATTANTTATAAQTTADSAVEKIGTLPTEYTTVGAALTAMKSDIDAKSLPSTSADGQYVLTAKKVGETISYTWVKMDLTNEEQSQ